MGMPVKTCQNIGFFFKINHFDLTILVAGCFYIDPILSKSFIVNNINVLNSVKCKEYFIYT